MSEIKIEAKVFLLNYECDMCKKGLMRRDGQIILMVDPPLFPHKCNNCGDVKNFKESYPLPRFEPIEGAEWIR